MRFMFFIINRVAELYGSKLFKIIPMKSINLMILFLLFIQVDIFGQYDGSIPQVTTVTPNAAALFKMTQRPIGTYTGTTPITLPLYEIRAGALTVPVTLNYANGGIRVEEIASWVGLGWNLTAGGRITRVVKGVPDDDANNGGMLHSSLKPSGFPGTPWIVNVNSILRGELDMEPDVYYFDCNGLSGKFFFDESGNPHIVSQQAIKIERQMIGFVIKGWILTDDRGIKYYFGMDKSQSVNYVDQSHLTYSSLGGYTTPNPSPSYISTWHLAEIKDINEENTIKLTYTRNFTQFQTLSSAYMSISGMVGMDCQPSDSYGDEMLVTNDTDEYYLTKIEGGMDSLVIQSSASRLDFLGGRKLEEIALYARNNVFIKKHRFNYEYFSKPYETGPDYFVKRLKLKNVSEFGTVAMDSLTHKFEYVENVNLPRRLSNATDYWGFYNGKDGNWTKLPNGVYRNGIYTYRRDNLGDRRSNPYYSTANTLKKITYPTGGTREFVYEGNQVLLEYDSQILPDASYYAYRSINEYADPFYDPMTPVISEEFTINSQEGSSNFTFNLGFGAWYGGVVVKIFQIFNPFSEYEVMSFYDKIYDDWVLDNGDYRIEVYTGFTTPITGIDCYWNEITLSNTIVYRYGEAYTANNINAGGIRVKEIKDYDPVAGKANTTSYQYSQFDENTLTSGMLVSPVRVAHQGGCNEKNCQYIRLNAQSMIPLGMEGGSYVVYPEVRTTESDNGKIDRTYSFIFDRAPSETNIYEFPILPSSDGSYLRNKLYLEKVYNNNDQLLKETYMAVNGYGAYPGSWSYNSSNQIGWKVVGYYKTYSCDHTGTAAGPCAGCWGQYSMYSSFTDLWNKREKTYDPVTGESQLVITDYDYHIDQGYPVLKEERVTLNNGDVRSTKYRYAFNATGDFTFGLNAAELTMKGALNAKHYWQPLEVVVTETAAGSSPVVTGGAKYSFATFGGSKIHLSIFRQYTSVSDYRETVFSSYDSYGNLQEKYLAGGPREVYLWGYMGSYPVAKILGSSYAAVSAWITPSILNNPTSDLTLRTHLNNIRTNLTSSTSPALVSTYTYKPLVGMTSETDAKGLTRYFEYDHFHRLNADKNHDGNLTRSIIYQYKH